MENGKKITGACSYKNFLAQQHEGVFDVFRKFLSEIKPKRILEIGTAAGGFTLFLRDTLDELGLHDSKIKTFEPNIHPNFDYLRERGVEIVHENIFDHEYMNIVKPEFVEPFINEEGTTLVLCDGGYKITEFRKLSPFLKEGDFIMAHDYSKDKEFFDEHINNKIWLWREISDEYIEDVFTINNLKPYNQEEFQNVVWLCMKKETNE
jgi:cephalosporin hydroxylase